MADKLFATLDTTDPALYPRHVRKVLLSDTVGFIKKLPHDLVASFKSTLDEAASASLLLFVVDASDPSFAPNLDVTRKVLGEVGATDVPSLLVLNKRDRLGTNELAALKAEYPDAVIPSTRNKDDLQALRERIMGYFESDMLDEELRIPFTAQSSLRRSAPGCELSEEYDAEGLTLRCDQPREPDCDQTEGRAHSETVAIHHICHLLRSWAAVCRRRETLSAITQPLHEMNI